MLSTPLHALIVFARFLHRFSRLTGLAWVVDLSFLNDQTVKLGEISNSEAFTSHCPYFSTPEDSWGNKSFSHQMKILLYLQKIMGH